ncbi:putative ribonuclease H-like domain-containing protein [Tanacetum coccineum]
MDDFCREKGIKREYSVARTPQQNGMAERRNRTLIEAARTMLADSKLPTTFWAEAVSTACYVQNRVLVVKPHNKTPYELFRGFKPALSFMRPFGYHVTILNTLDSLAKFDGKSDEGFFVGYSLSSKAFRVYNTRTRRVEENLHIRFFKNKPMIERNGPKWLFDIDSLTQSINYVPVAAGTIINESAGTQGELNVEDGPDNENDEKDKYEDDSSPKEVNTAGQHVNTASPEVNTYRFKLNTVGPSVNTARSYDQDSPKDMFTMGASHTLKATHVEFFSDEDELEVDLRNITNSYTVPTTPNTRIHKDHPIENVIGGVKTSVQTRRMTKPTSKQGFLRRTSAIQTPTGLDTCRFAYRKEGHWNQMGLSFKLNTVDPSVNTASSYDQDSPKDMFTMGASHTLEATHVEFFSDEDEPEVDLGNITNSYTVLNTPNTRIHNDHPIENVIGDVKSYVQTRRMTKPTSKQGIVKALSDSSWVEEMQEKLLQFKLQQVWILMDLPIGNRAIRTKWVFRNKKDKRGIMIRNKARLVAQGFKDPDHPDKVYKVVKALYGLHQAPRAWYETLANYLLGNGFKRGKIDLTLFIKKQKGDILLVQVYVDDIIFGSINKELFDLEKAIIKDGDSDDVVYILYRFMIGPLMHLHEPSRPDIMFAEIYKKGGCQFLGNAHGDRGCIAEQCKKQTVVVTSTTEAEYVAAASCCGQIYLQKVLMLEGVLKRIKTLGMSKESGAPRYLSLVVPLKKVGDEAVHKELSDRMERAATTASSLEAK